MCGRMTLELDLETVREILRTEFHVSEEAIHDFRPNDDIRPTDSVISIIEHQGQYRAGQLTWGFVPSWVKAKKGLKPLINVRSETLDQKPSFREAYKKRRCIVLASGYYEWDKKQGTKDKYIFQEADHPWIALAGIWNKSVLDGETYFNCGVLTTEANEEMARIHHRMPVSLSQEEVRQWLNPRSSDADLKPLFDMSKKVLVTKICKT